MEGTSELLRDFNIISAVNVYLIFLLIRKNIHTKPSEINIRKGKWLLVSIYRRVLLNTQNTSDLLDCNSAKHDKAVSQELHHSWFLLTVRIQQIQ